MFCIAQQKHIRSPECPQFILQADSAGIALCRVCPHGQTLMRSVRQQPDEPMTTPGGAVMARKNNYSYKDIAELAEVTIKAVENTLWRMRKGIVPSRGNAKKIADTLVKHGISLDQVGYAQKNGDAPKKKSQPAVAKPRMAPAAPASKASMQVPTQVPREAHADEADPGAQAEQAHVTQQPEAPQTAAVPPEKVAIIPDNVIDVWPKGGIQFWPEQQVPHQKTASLPLDCFSTDTLLKELKRRHPNGTVSISL